MNNCFTYTYKKLISKGYNVPTKWDCYSIRDMRMFITEQKYFLERKVHYKFFESFCEYVNEAKENDIIIDDEGVGVAINKFKYMTLRDRNSKAAMLDITKDKKILRIINGKCS